MKALAIITALCFASGVHAGHVWAERPEDVDKEMRVRTERPERFRSAPRATSNVLRRTTGTDKFFCLDSIVAVYPKTGEKMVDRCTYTATGQPSKRVIASWDPSTNAWETKKLPVMNGMSMIFVFRNGKNTRIWEFVRIMSMTFLVG